MTDLAIVLIGTLCLLILVNSALRFLWGGLFGDGDRFLRLGAAASGVLAALLVCVLYSGAYRLHGVLAARAYVDDRETVKGIRSTLIQIDEFFTDVGNFLSPGPEQGFRPHPALAPLIVLVVIYLIRLALYVGFERRDLRNATTTAASYWAFFAAYAMVVGFLLDFVEWTIVPVAILTVVAIVLVLSPVMDLVQDLGHTVLDGMRSVRHVLVFFAAHVAEFAAKLARGARYLYEESHRLYRERVSRRLRGASGSMVRKSAALAASATEGLAAENERHRSMFRRKGDHGPPSDGPAPDEAPDLPPLP